MKFSSLLHLAMALTVSAQGAGTTAPYLEPKSGITFQTFTDATGYAFGLALPTTPSTDFIGLIVGKGKEWSGQSSPPPEASGSYTMIPIAAGTYTNTTHWSYTFLCKGCILSDGTTFAGSDSTGVLGWAFSASALTTPASKSTAFTRHEKQGNSGFDFKAAKTEKYATYAAMADNKTAAMTFVA